MKNISAVDTTMEQVVVDTKVGKNMESYINSTIDFANHGRIVNVDCDEKGVLTLTFEKYAQGKAFCKVFSRSKIIRSGRRRNGKEIKRGYDSLEEAKKAGIDETQRRNLARNGFKIVKEIELKECWLVFYAN